MFPQLRCTHEQYKNATNVLSPFSPPLPTEQNWSDFRQLVRSLASGADAFITRDEALLSRSDEVYRACGLSVLRPSELIGRLDELLREHEYQHGSVSGTKQLIQRRVSSADADLIDAIHHANEPTRPLRAAVNRMLADPNRFRCVAIRDLSGELLAFCATESREARYRIVLLRVTSGRLAGTLARSILTELIRATVNSGRTGLFIDDHLASQDDNLAAPRRLVRHAISASRANAANSTIGERRMILAYHSIFSMYGFWLPNDPAGRDRTMRQASKTIRSRKESGGRIGGLSRRSCRKRQSVLLSPQSPHAPPDRRGASAAPR